MIPMVKDCDHQSTSLSILIMTSVSINDPQLGIKWKETNLSFTHLLFIFSGYLACIRNRTGAAFVGHCS